MTHIAAIDPDRADSATSATLAAVRAKLGMLPNLIATLAHAPAALNGYLALSETLAGGRLSARQREIVALTVAQANACQYCLSAHTAIARGAGLDPEEIAAARAGRADAPLDRAIARFARQLVEQRARLSPGDLQALRREGLDDGLTIEIVAHVVLNLLTNYVNHVAGTEVDFPPVSV